MIKSINHKSLRQLWETGKSSKLPVGQVNKIMQMLEVIDSAQRYHRILNFSEVEEFIHYTENGKVIGVLLLRKTGVSYSDL